MSYHILHVIYQISYTVYHISYTTYQVSYIIYLISHVIFNRLWIEPKQSGDPPQAQVLAYVTFVPQCLDKGGIMSKPTFEGLDAVFSTANQYLQQNPLQGNTSIS